MTFYLIAIATFAAAWALTAITLTLGWGLAARNLNGDPHDYDRIDAQIEDALWDGWAER